MENDLKHIVHVGVRGGRRLPGRESLIHETRDVLSETPKKWWCVAHLITEERRWSRSKHAPGAHGRRKAKGNPSAGSSSPCCWKGSAIGETRGKHTLPTARLTSRPSSPTAHSGLHSLHRTIIGHKDYDASISNISADLKFMPPTDP